MKNFWTSLSKKKGLLLFFIVLFVIGVVFGVCLFFQNPESREISLNLTEQLQEGTISFVQSHLFLFMGTFLLSFFIIGIPIFLFALFFEGLSLGFTFALFIFHYQWGGFLYMLIFTLLFKAFFLFLIFFLFYKYLLCARYTIYRLFYKIKDYELLETSCKSIFIFIAILFLYDFIVGIVGAKFMGWCLFLLK